MNHGPSVKIFARIDRGVPHSACYFILKTGKNTHFRPRLPSRFVECLYVARVRIARFDLRYDIDEYAFAHRQPSQSVYAFVAALALVGFHAGTERGRPALKLEWVVGRQLSGVLQCLGHADEFNVVPQTVEMSLDPLLDDLAGLDANINANPATPEILGGVNGRAAATEWVEDNIIRVA